MAKPKMRCDMKKRTNLIFLIFPLIWAFYFIFMKGHILHWESTDFFVRDWGYSQQFLLKPGGWGEYLSHFVLQYFQWPWLGALVLCIKNPRRFARRREVCWAYHIIFCNINKAFLQNILVLTEKCPKTAAFLKNTERRNCKTIKSGTRSGRPRTGYRPMRRRARRQIPADMPVISGRSSPRAMSSGSRKPDSSSAGASGNKRLRTSSVMPRMEAKLWAR